MNNNSFILEAKLPVKIIKRKKYVIASCPVFDVHSQGKDKEEALHNLQEALYLFFISCIERGTLDEVLRESGFKPARRKSRSKKVGEMITVPIPMIKSKDSVVPCPA